MVRENYFVQETFYAAAYYELTGIPGQKNLSPLWLHLVVRLKYLTKGNKGDYIKLLFVILKNLYLTILGQRMENELEKALESKFFLPISFRTREIEVSCPYIKK